MMVRISLPLSLLITTRELEPYLDSEVIALYRGRWRFLPLLQDRTN